VYNNKQSSLEEWPRKGHLYRVMIFHLSFNKLQWMMFFV